MAGHLRTASVLLGPALQGYTVDRLYGGRRLTVGQNQTTKFFFKFGGIMRLIPLKTAHIPLRYASQSPPKGPPKGALNIPLKMPAKVPLKNALRNLSKGSSIISQYF